MNGVDISGISNTLEISIVSEIVKTGGNRLSGQVSTTVRQKAFFRKGDVEKLNELLTGKLSYSFNREDLEYKLDGVEVFLSKDSCIAGVVPVELVVCGETKPTRTRINV